jgi:hypothetical protein
LKEKKNELSGLTKEIEKRTEKIRNLEKEKEKYGL